MINIKELSVGNLVKFPHGIDKIIDLPYVEGKGVCASFAASATLFPVSVEDLEPIEITPEILEKNGFEKREFINEVNCKEEYWIYCDDYYSLVISEINDGLYKVEHHSEELINLIEQLYISYIHQLQNALTLCGISKEIKL